MVRPDKLDRYISKEGNFILVILKFRTLLKVKTFFLQICKRSRSCDLFYSYSFFEGALRTIFSLGIWIIKKFVYACFIIYNFCINACFIKKYFNEKKIIGNDGWPVRRKLSWSRSWTVLEIPECSWSLRRMTGYLIYPRIRLMLKIFKIFSCLALNT